MGSAYAQMREGTWGFLLDRPLDREPCALILPALFSNRKEDGMGLARAMKRAACRRAGIEWPSVEQPYKAKSDGGYTALRPTKGWMKMSGRRLKAIDKMERMIGPFPRKR